MSVPNQEWANAELLRWFNPRSTVWLNCLSRLLLEGERKLDIALVSACWMGHFRISDVIDDVYETGFNFLPVHGGHGDLGLCLLYGAISEWSIDCSLYRKAIFDLARAYRYSTW